MDDRRVHARIGSLEVVRYDRAGKWYLEADGSRQPIKVPMAAKLVVASMDTHEVEVFFDLPGGRAFDRQVRAGLR